MRIAFIGCVQSSHRALTTLVSMSHKEIEVVAVVTKEKSDINADFVDLTPLCIKHEIPFHFEQNNERNLSREFLAGYNPDVIYCFGWSYLLDKALLDTAIHGAIGFHPAPLPLCRGRHPIIWALALGLKETASTFFLMDENADSGPILSQVPVAIDRQDNATTLYQKILDISEKQIMEFSVKLARDEAEFKRQDSSIATYWRKRTRMDGLIDWRMQAVDIHNLVRALSCPYPGAEFMYQNVSVCLRESSMTPDNFSNIIEPGRVLEIKDRKILVKCGGTSALWIKNLKINPTPAVGDYL